MRKAEPIAGLGGLLLLVSIFVWGPSPVIAVVLAILALLAVAVPVVALAAKGPAGPIGTAVVASALGWIAIVIVAIELLVGNGSWLALAGSILAWVGSWLSLRDESTPGAVPPAIPRRPAPPNISEQC